MSALSLFSCKSKRSGRQEILATNGYKNRKNLTVKTHRYGRIRKTSQNWSWGSWEMLGRPTPTSPTSQFSNFSNSWRLFFEAAWNVARGPASIAPAASRPNSGVNTKLCAFCIMQPCYLKLRSPYVRLLRFGMEKVKLCWKALVQPVLTLVTALQLKARINLANAKGSLWMSIELLFFVSDGASVFEDPHCPKRSKDLP